MKIENVFLIYLIFFLLRKVFHAQSITRAFNLGSQGPEIKTVTIESGDEVKK